MVDESLGVDPYNFAFQVNAFVNSILHSFGISVEDTFD